MAGQLIADKLWAVVAPLLPVPAPHPQGGRPRGEDRAALTGILFVLRSGIAWEMLPAEMGCGCGCGTTCWRRLRDRHEAGAWQRLHRVLPDRLGVAGRLDWSRASPDAQSIPAAKGGRRPVHIQRTAANRAPSATHWQTDAAPRWPCS